MNSDNTTIVTATTPKEGTTSTNFLDDLKHIKAGSVYGLAGFVLGVIVTCIFVKCYYSKRRKLAPISRTREDSYHHDNAVYWDHEASLQINGLAELRERRRTETVIISDSRHVGIQTDIDLHCMEELERHYRQPIQELEPDSMSLGPLPPPPPPPFNEDPLPVATVQKPPRRTSKDDCIPKVPSYRQSNFPGCLQKTWVFNSNDKLSSSNNFEEFLDEAFKDQNSPLHQGQDHYMSVPSVVLIPNPEEEDPPPCHEIRHSYINIKKAVDKNNLSENSSLNHSQQILVDYENTRVWMKSKQESDVSDDETYVDCRDKNFQDSVRDTLRRKQSQSSAMPDTDQYSSFATLSAPKKPERPRTGYVVMELTDEVMSFLKVRENKLGKHITVSREDISSDIYYDDRMKNGYLSMHDEKR